MRLSRRTIFKAATSLPAAALFLLMSGCADSRTPGTDAPAQNSPTPASAAAPSPAPSQAPPGPELLNASPADLRECVRRIYGDAVTVEEGRPVNYVTGDFNGDRSQDIAVYVRPAEGRLDELNEELASWVLEDPREVQDPAAGKVSATPGPAPARVKVEQGDLLLAVIHGHGGGGWRDPAATQTYLLRNAAGDDLKTLKRPEALGVLRSSGRTLMLRGDVLSETLARERGFLYWNGAKYAWHRLA